MQHQNKKERIDDLIIANKLLHAEINESRRAEEKMRINVEIFRNAFECSAVGIAMVKLDGKLKINEAFRQILGYSEKELSKMRWQDITHPDDIERDQKIINSIMSGERKTARWEKRYIRNNGTTIWVDFSTTLLHDIKGQPFYFINSINDITERKKVEDALRESESRFRSLYENATIGLYRTTPDGKILLANPVLVKMLEYSSFQELAQRNLEKEGFGLPDQRKEFIEKIERDGVVHSYESKWICRDGKSIFVLESARAIRDSQGRTLYYDGTVEDITQRKLLEEQLRQMQKLEGLGTLAGGIAHDFNNLLAIILAYITSIKESKDNTQKIDLVIDTITRAVDRGKILVQQILTFARKTETAFGPVSVNNVVNENAVMIIETFPKVISYIQNFEKDIPFIHADRSQLGQALLNLCVNARDAMPNGGVLTINTCMISGIKMRNRYSDATVSSYICIEVSDTGEGMTPEIQKRIFEPFFTTKKLGKGTGLGLSVVFGVIQTHKGYVDVESELGKGTTFRLYFPISQALDTTSIEVGETLIELPGGTETLLLVEDEEMLLMTLQTALVEKGYNVILATDGMEALNIYKERKNDIALLLTDLGLPKMTGLDECFQIKQINPNVRIIVATGFLDPEIKSKFLEMGIQHFLRKPYNLQEALRIVRKALDEK